MKKYILEVEEVHTVIVKKIYELDGDTDGYDRALLKDNEGLIEVIEETVEPLESEEWVSANKGGYPITKKLKVDGELVQWEGE